MKTNRGLFARTPKSAERDLASFDLRGSEIFDNNGCFIHHIYEDGTSILYKSNHCVIACNPLFYILSVLACIRVGLCPGHCRLLFCCFQDKRHEIKVDETASQNVTIVFKYESFTF